MATDTSIIEISPNRVALEISQSRPTIEFSVGTSLGVQSSLTLENLGAGSEVFKSKTGDTVDFRTLTAGANISLTQSSTEIEIAFTAGAPIDFSATGLTTTTVVDSFAYTVSVGAEWHYVVYDGVTNTRVGVFSAVWATDSSDIEGENGPSSMDIGDTSHIEFSVAINAGNVELTANIDSGTWTVKGYRQHIPSNGTGSIAVGNATLPEGQIFIGNASDEAVAQAVSGDITITSGGVTAISSGVIVNADISSSASIAVSKLAALTASKAVVTNSSGVLTTSSTTSTELSYVHGVTSAIQTQLAGKQATITGAATTVTSSNLTASKALVSNGSGKIAVSSVTSTELGYLSGASSNLQDQIDALFGASYAVAVFNIGTWNMDSTAYVYVDLTGIALSDIRSVNAMVRADDDASSPGALYSAAPYNSNNTAGTKPELGIDSIFDNSGTARVLIRRVDSSTFDSTDFNKTSGSYNRGYVMVLYVA